MTPLPEFHVWTPLGKAVCTGVFADAEDPEWLTWIVETGEPWWWTGRHIRRAPNVTNARPLISGFFGLNGEIFRHIRRYQAHSFLPADFDPARPETWA